MKTAKDFHRIHGIAFFVLWLLLIPAISTARTDAPAALDPSIIPWLGVWRAVEEPIASDIDSLAESGVLEIRPAAGGNGLEITRTGPEKPVSETIVPDGSPRTQKTDGCTAAQTYQWEPQTGLLMGSSEIRCGDSPGYGLSNIKMMLTPGRMADILAIRTPGQTRIAVRHFVFEKEVASEAAAFPDQARWALRSALTAPWDLDKIIHLSTKIETPVLQAVLLEKEVQVRVDARSLKRLKAARLPDDIVDLLIALALPEKFQIHRNGKVALAAPLPSAEGSAAYVYRGDPYYDPYGYYYGYGRYSGYGYPWGSYWSHSPFWWGYPLYVYPVPVGGGGGGGGEVPPSSAGGRLSSARGYVEITPLDAAPKAVPRNGAIVRSGSSTGRISSGGTAVAAPSSSGGGYSGGGSSSSGGANSAPAVSPSGYSGGGGGGQAVPRN